MLRTFTVACVLTLLVVTPARAYLDLGTGSYLLQVVLASVVSVVYLLRSYWTAIKAALFGRPALPASKEPDDEEGGP